MNSWRYGYFTLQTIINKWSRGTRTLGIIKLFTNDLQLYQMFGNFQLKVGIIIYSTSIKSAEISWSSQWHTVNHNHP